MNQLNCPKCSGGAYAADEELVKILENTTPIKIVLKTTFVCRSCNERFSRIIYDDLDARKRPQQWQPAPGMPTHEHALQPGISATGQTQEPAEKLKFLDNL